MFLIKKLRHFFKTAGVHYQHLQAVFDVGETYIGFVIKRENHYVGVVLLYFSDYTASADVVGEAAEGLEYYKGADALRGVVQNIGGY